MDRTTARAAWLAMAPFLCGFLAAPRPAQACSLNGNAAHHVDPQARATDTTPPGAPTLAVDRIKRGKGAEACGRIMSSCDDLGWIAVRVSAADDQTPAASLGYRIELASGSLPSGLALPTNAVRAGQEGQEGFLMFDWIDGASDDQETLSFSLAISAVDLAGNVGPASTIHISDGGSGCSLAARSSPATPGTAALVILLVGLGLARGRRIGKA